MKENILSKERS